MNRTDRLLALILELQRRGTATALGLARRFETSKRTIYRDMQALLEAGVPVISVPGQGYSLSDDYFLPPLRFTVEEATLALLGLDVMAQSFDAGYARAAESAGQKIEAVLPDRQRPDVGYLRANLRFVASRSAGKSQAQVWLRQIRSAIVSRNTLQFKYDGRFKSGDRTLARRRVDPYSLAHVDGTWYVLGHDRDRGALRNFRLERISDLTITARVFQRPARVRFGDASLEERPLEVRVRVAPEAARWVVESPSYFQVAERETAAGLELTLRVRHLDEIFNWVLSWGTALQVLAPAALRDRVRAEARALADQYLDAAPAV
jgi:predicted DNA-binding transcriptional regulator YafY